MLRGRTIERPERELFVFEFKDCANDVDQYKRAKGEFNVIERIDRKIKKNKKAIRKSYKQKAFRKRMLKAHTICSGALGFSLGFAFAASQILATHGPTTNLWSTILASLLHFAVGALFALGFAYVGKFGSKSMINYLTEKSEWCRSEIKLLEAEKKERIGQAAMATARAAFDIQQK